MEVKDIFADAPVSDPAPSHTPSKIRREIDISGHRNLNEILMDLLRAVGNTIYHSDGTLVDIQYIDGEYVIRDLSETELVNYLSKECDFFRINIDKKGVETKAYTNSPTLQQRKDVMNSTRIILKQVRELKGLTHAPTLLGDGTVLTKKGFHEPSGLFVVNDCDVEIPHAPDREQAKFAAQQFLDVFQDYPFETDVDPWLYLTAHLTAAGRRALGHHPIPGCYINAFDRGAGKSALTESIPNVSFQGTSARSGWPGQSEMEKRITAWGLSKPEAIVFDNIKSHMAGASIEDCITSAKFGGRILGKTQGAKGRFLSYFIVNANDGQMSEDLARRFIHIRITRQTRRSDQYRMKNTTPVDYCLKNNQQMKAKLITILKAWMIHGEVQEARRLSSFERWSDLVLGASEWVANDRGKHQFETQKDREVNLRSEESQSEQVPVILFHEISDGTWFGAHDIYEIANTPNDVFADGKKKAKAVSLLQIIGGANNVQTGRRFAQLLKRHENNTYYIEDSGYKIESTIKRGYKKFRTVLVESPPEKEAQQPDLDF